MGRLLDLIYLTAWLIASPWLCWQALFGKKPIRGLKAKWFGQVPAVPEAASHGRPVAWFHGVSVGEIHLLRQLIGRFRTRFPHWQCVVSTTTATGHDEAKKHFSDLPVFFWPFDFSWAVKRALRTVQPKMVVLSEGEIWPNFIAAAKRDGVKIALVNARMSPKSAGRFLRFRRLLSPIFAQIDWIGAQNDDYRSHYHMLGAKSVSTTGNIKYDGVATDRRNPKTQALVQLLAIGPDALTWIAGSTQAPEETLALAIYARAKPRFPNLRLILVPRHPERFDEVADLLQRSGLPFIRRSELSGARLPLATHHSPLVLVDTMGELGALWGLADVAFVGGSLDGKRGGQNMIEPSAHGAAVLFGPHTWNFKQTVADLLQRDAAIQVQDAAELESAVIRLLGDAALRRRMGEAARQFVLSQQGATERTLDALADLMELHKRSEAA